MAELKPFDPNFFSQIKPGEIVHIRFRNEKGFIFDCHGAFLEITDTEDPKLRLKTGPEEADQLVVPVRWVFQARSMSVLEVVAELNSWYGAEFVL